MIMDQSAIRGELGASSFGYPISWYVRNIADASPIPAAIIAVPLTPGASSA
jgi:hypothetical protein